MRRSGVLTAPLPVTLAAVALLGLGGCGDDAERAPDSAATPTASPTPSSGSSPSGCPEPSETVRLLGIGNAGGEVDLTATPVGTAADLAEFTDDLTVDAAQVRDFVATAPRTCGQVPVLAVVALGCDEPTVTLAPAEPWRFTAMAGKSTRQCLVPTTWFALATVPAPD